MNKLMSVILILGMLGMSGAYAQEVPANSARVSWAAPTARVDGTPLAAAELASYQVYWGPGATLVEQNTQVVVGTSNLLLITGLAPGTWHFGVKAVDTGGLISTMSQVVTKTIILADPLPPLNIEVQ